MENISEVRPDVLNYDDLRQMVPQLDGHPKLVNALLKFLSVDKVNVSSTAYSGLKFSS